MRQAETVTFGGSGHDRAQHLRASPEALQAAWAHAAVLPFWRGLPLTEGEGDKTRLACLPADHPFVADAAERLFLGQNHDEGGGATGRKPLFAVDVSASLTENSPDFGPFDRSRLPHPALPSTQGFSDLRAVMAGLSPQQAELAAMAKALLEWHRSHGFCAACGAPSQMTSGGWQRRCPACAAPHFPRTDPVVIMLVTDGNRLLLGRSPGWPDGMYSLLAGFVEPGETMEAAVRREVAEETGVQIGAVGYLASQPWPFPASLMLGCRAEALTTEITLDPDELQDALWVSRADMVAAFAGSHPRIRPSRRGSIARFIITAWLADHLD